ncbi:nuclear transport factor 2 family protein [Shinella sp.]|uniref:nuclear transport factor 2 family protein n=1 Tax=Shinella sp. TaxID=1870904 RepID=UPI003F70B60C
MTPDELALEAAEDAFNRAMLTNDIDAIRKCVTPQWVLVTPEKGPVSGEAVLEAIRSGVLGHDTMSKRTHLIRVFGDVAFVTGRGENTGWFRGEPIRADEWITDVYRRIDGRWVCELTHLTPAAQSGAQA